VEQDRRAELGLEAFRSSRDQFEKLVELMDAEATRKMSHGELEDLLSAEGFELLRRLLQDHLVLRAQREQRVVALNCDRIELSHHRQSSERKLESVFGTVTVTRRCYYKPDAGSAHPLDVELNLPGHRYSHGMEERVAEEAAKVLRTAISPQIPFLDPQIA